jgi:hypothetical protein
MGSRNSFRQVTFARKLDVKRLRVALARTMRESMKNPSPSATLARVESVFIQADKTTVLLSGDPAGLNAVGVALHRSFPDANVSRASRRDVMRRPRATASSS